MSTNLLSLSTIVAVAVLLDPIITVLTVEVKVAVNISSPSSISSFATETLTYCTVSPGAKVTGTLLSPLKSAGSEEEFNSCVTVMSQWVFKSMCYVPVALPAEVLKSTETVCVVGVSFTTRNLTTAPSASVTVYAMGSNCTMTTVKVQEHYTSS